MHIFCTCSNEICLVIILFATLNNLRFIQIFACFRVFRRLKLMAVVLPTWYFFFIPTLRTLLLRVITFSGLKTEPLWPSKDLSKWHLWRSISLCMSVLKKKHLGDKQAKWPVENHDRVWVFFLANLKERCPVHLSLWLGWPSTLQFDVTRNINK